MKIQDVSDRVYQGRVYALLDRAKSSITISMYLLRPGEDSRHPVNRLLQDLIDARGRGVSVEIYLNSKFKGGDPRKLIEGPWFDRLRQAGVVIKLVSPVRRLHDKLVIVDRHFVVEGSTNWSVAAIADNLESATIIESPQLAESKLRRIGFFPIWGEETKKLPTAQAPEEALFPAGPPTSIEIPIALLEERRFFPKMISYQRARALKLYLLFLYLAEAKAADKFSVSLEAAGDFVGIVPGKGRTAVRREVIRVLRDLEKIDRLLKPEFRHGKPAWIELFPPAGEKFTIGSGDLNPGEFEELTDNELFFRLMRARLRSEGKRLEDLTQAEIKRRFFIGGETVNRTPGAPKFRPGRKPASAQV